MELKFLFNCQHLCEGAWIPPFLCVILKYKNRWTNWLITRQISENQSISTNPKIFFVVTCHSFQGWFFLRAWSNFLAIHNQNGLKKRNILIILTKIFIVILIKFYGNFRYFKVTMIRKRWYPMCCRSTSGLVSSGSGPRLGSVNTEPWG